MTYYPCRHDGFRIRLIGTLAVVTIVTTIYIKIMEKADTTRATKEAYRNAYLYKNENGKEMRVNHESDEDDVWPNKRNEFKYRQGRQVKTIHSKEAAGGVTWGRGAPGRGQSPAVGDDSLAGRSSLPEVITLPDVKSLLGDDGVADDSVAKRRGTRPREEGRETATGQNTPGRTMEVSGGGRLKDGYGNGSVLATKNAPAFGNVLRGRIVQEDKGALHNGTVSDGILAKWAGSKTRITEREQALGHSMTGKEGNSSIGGGVFEGHGKGSPPGAKREPGGDSVLGAKREPGGDSVLGTKREPGGDSVLGAKREPGGDSVLGAKREPGGDSVLGAKREPGGDSVLGAKREPGGDSVLGAKREPGGDSVLGAKREPGGDSVLGAKREPGGDSLLVTKSVLDGDRVLGGEMVQVSHGVLKKETIPDGVSRGGPVTGGHKVTGRVTLQGGHDLPRKGIEPEHRKSLGSGAVSGGDSAAGGAIAPKGNGGLGKRIAPEHEVVLERNNLPDGNSVQGREILPEDERVIGIVPGDTVPTRIVTELSTAGTSPSLPNGRRSTTDKNGVSDEVLRDRLPDPWGYSGVGSRSEDVIVPSDDVARKDQRLLILNTDLDRLLKEDFVSPVPVGFSRADHLRYGSKSGGGRVQGVDGVSAGSRVQSPGGASAGSQVQGTKDVSAGSQGQVTFGAPRERVNKSQSDSLRSGGIKTTAPRVSLGGGANVHKGMANTPVEGANVHGVVGNVLDNGSNLTVGDTNIPSRGANVPENINYVIEAGKIVPGGGIETDASGNVPGGVQAASRKGTRVHGHVDIKSSDITSRKAVSTSEDGKKSRIDNVISGNYVPDAHAETTRTSVHKVNNAPGEDYIPEKKIPQNLEDQVRDAQSQLGESSPVGKLKRQQKERTLTEQVTDSKETIPRGNSVLPSESFRTPVPTLTRLKIKNMSNTDLLSAISRLLSHVDIRCHSIHNYTGLFGGVWFLCDDPGVSIEPPCQMYSFSVQADLALDATVAEERKCTVTSNDPNLESAKGLNRSAPMSSAANQHVHHPRTFTSLDVDSELGRNRTSLDVIKMDVEGLEWGALPRMIASGQLTGVRQLIVQFHVYDTRRGHLTRQLRCIQTLEKAGFKKFVSRFRDCQQFINESYFDSKCYDVGFLRI